MIPTQYKNKVEKAVRHYWSTLEAQSRRQVSGKEVDRGTRTAVTGGKQMSEFCELIRWTVKLGGLSDAHIFIDRDLQLPGYFRPTKKWDILVIKDECLIAAIELKSQAGPSFGNNFNNRAEEAIGSTADLWTAYREGVLGPKNYRPWVGWVMLLEDCKKSTDPVEAAEPHFAIMPEFTNSSYSKRYELLLRKLTREKLIDGGAFLTSSRSQGKTGKYSEPTSDLSIHKFLVDLVSRVTAFVENSEENTL